MSTTEQAKHTPGPWAIFDLGDETRINVRGPNEEFIADCADGFYNDNGDWVMADDSLPNARLIAAAPDGLDAARMALALIEDMSRFVGQMSLRDYALFNEAPIALRRFIAKAEGR